jgi:thiamine-phosphate pyrophosphorylase
VSPSNERRERLARARLYLVAGARPGGRPLAEVLEPALAGGVDVFQLREKDASDDDLLAAAGVARELCTAAGALFILNDRPDLVAATGADGAHVGQDDMPVARARELAGPGALIGRSTHSPAQVDAAHSGGADYLGVGPVHATPTKPGRAAVGLDLVTYAAAHATRPWFAIGGIGPDTIGAVTAAGALRAAVVRAITDAADPRAVAAGLRAALETVPLPAPAGAAHG